MFGQNSGRFRTTDFFGIVLPGFFLVLQIALLVLAFCGSADSRDAYVTTTKDLWAPSLILLIFVSYVIGSVFRTWTISDTDELCGTLLPPPPADSPRRFSRETAFPYREMLRDYKAAIWMSLSNQERNCIRKLHVACETDEGAVCEGKKEKKMALRDCVPPFGLFANESEDEDEEPCEDEEPWKSATSSDWYVGERVYNYWKARLCVSAPSGFEFAEATEARTRFFFGMLWAARWSLRFMAFTSAVVWSCRVGCSGGWPPRWQIPLFSCILVVTAIIESIRPMHTPAPWLKRKLTRLSKVLGKKSTAAKALFWASVVLEMLLTPILLYYSPGRTSSTMASDRLVLAVVLVVSAASLFLFLAKRLRRVREREVRAVYLNYVAFVLASYWTATPPSAHASGRGDWSRTAEASPRRGGTP